MNRAKILETANATTHGPREADYGTPAENMADIAAGWAVIFRDGVTPERVALAQAWVKTCRALRSPDKVDHYVDGAAYFAIAGEVADGHD